ncbi:MAG TPA: efflux RND transporter permease subunit [Vicinamibacterales bacterium]
MTNEQHQIERTHNTARFFTESRHVAWVLLVATCVWGVFGYMKMPQRKDPDIPVRQALALCPWPGASAEKIEQLVTRRIEEKIAENVRVEKIESNTRTGITAVYITLVEGTKDTAKEFDDIKLKLDAVTDLPDGAGPIDFVKDFGDTAALMLTVASPRASDADVRARADAVRKELVATRRAAGSSGGSRITFVQALPSSVPTDLVRRPLRLFADAATAEGVVRDARIILGSGFIAVDAISDKDDTALREFVQRFTSDRLRASEFHPDAWPVAVIRDPSGTEAQLLGVAGDKYSYRELDDYTDLIARTLKALPMVSKVTLSGLLQEQVYLEYSQERLAAYGVKVGALDRILGARNISIPGGIIESGDKKLTIDPSGEFKSEHEIGDVLVPTTNGRSLYLRDLVTVARGYESPARFLNFHSIRNEKGEWRRARAVTLAVQMRSGEKIGEFGEAVDAKLEELKAQVPADLIFARTSDQPLQVDENIHLFMGSLYEAVALVVLVSLIGFWEWRSALLMAFSIPITLAMTFGMMQMLGIDLQQVSIASLIIALGLLVDDPVVAGDAIKRDLAAGHPPIVAAWWGPTKLAKAILFATITNIVAYAPFLLLPGDSGNFIYSLPVVIGCSLVASRVVSMTFIPLLGYYLLRPKAEPPIEERRKSGFAAAYYRIGSAAIRHRWAFLTASLAILALGGVFMSQLKTQFFPKDLQYLSYVDVWLPEDAPAAATNRVAREVEATIQRVADEYAKAHSDDPKQPRTVLKSLTTFVGGGGPRFWLSVAPEQRQPNYAQVIVEAIDKHDTTHLVEAIQSALSATIPGVRLDVRQLETGAPVGIPVSIRVSGEDPATLRRLAGRVSEILRSNPTAVRVRDNWGPESFAVRLRTDSDKANLSGLTNYDVAAAAASAMSGVPLSALREGDRQIPIVARLRMEERARLSDIRSLYVYASEGQQKVPLQSISSVVYEMQTEKLQRRNQFPTVTISAFTTDGVLPSELLSAVRPQLDEFQKTLPTAYHMEIGGEHEEQVKNFKQLAIVMLISIVLIYLALVFQFGHAIKPVIVFAAIPYGIVGALAVLWLMGSAFGFMAFLGIASLIGVIVSHIIVLFDFIEERHAEGESLQEALLDAGIIRLRPVLITVAATVTALFPLAAHGGPLWEPLCYAQIGGLTFATFVTLLLVPVIYATFVLDLKLVRWDAHERREAPAADAAVSMA